MSDRALLLSQINDEAEALLAQSERLQNFTLGGRRVGEADINRRACRLLEQCSFADLPPPLTLSLLIAHRLGINADPFVEKTRSIPAKDEKAWDRAVLFEASHPADPDGDTPSRASLNAATRAAYPTSHGKGQDQRRTVQGWQKNDQYQRDVAATRAAIEMGLVKPANVEQRNRGRPRKNKPAA